MGDLDLSVKSVAPLRVLHVITSLHRGGAEGVLRNLVLSSNRAEYQHEVVTLLDRGEIGTELKRLGIRVEALDMKGAIMSPLALIRLVKLMQTQKPDVVQCWMPHGNLLGGLAAWLNGRQKVIWNLRQAYLGSRVNRASTRWVIRTCARLSRRIPTRIICASSSALESHVNAGYNPHRMLVIPNGFDLPPESSYRERAAIRGMLGLPPSAVAVALIARFDPAKDHHTFVQAAREVNQRTDNVHWVLVGRDVDSTNGLLKHWIGEDAECWHLLGERRDIPAILAAVDVVASSSFTEAFPNALGESMAQGVPCVATDVGDTSFLLGDTGILVPAGDPIALAEGLERMVALSEQERAELGRRAKARIRSQFSIQAMVSRYESLYREVVNCAASPGS